MFNQTFLAVGLLALTNTITALPTEATSEIVYPEVYPGPGLPSLASLGLTSKDLHTMKPKLNGRAVQFDGRCQTFSTANVNDAMACYNFLNSIGSSSCGTNTANIIMCSTGTVQVSGANLLPGTSQTASCANCAVGALWSIQNCNNGGQVGGQAPAFGNGNLIMGVQNFNWAG
ncbi:hypothetical protein B0J14DRAFT_632943 [Halenospora varia]|nr:hypothetical protein B0J14DRAFT_632943 [Halenospora varia]